MGTLDRGRIARILAGTEKPMVNSGTSLPGRVLERVEKAVGGAAAKNLRRRFEKMDLPSQVKMAQKMRKPYAMVPNGEIEFRKRMLDGIESEFKDWKKAGKTDEEILKPYLGCPEFMEFWASMGFDEYMLKSFLGLK